MQKELMNLKDMIETTLEEFEKFTGFIKNERPILSSKLGVLGKKDSYKLNMLLHYKKDVSGPNYNQEQYPVIDLMFSLAMAGGLYVKANNEKGTPALVETVAMESFKALTRREKYVFLLQTYWTKYNFDEKFVSWFKISSFYNILVSAANAEKGQRIMKDERGLYWDVFSLGAAFLHHLRFFGLVELEEIEGAKGRYEDSIKAFIPNKFGIQISYFLLTKALHLWGHKDLWFILPEKEAKKKSKNTENSFDVFRRIFNDFSVVNTVVSKNDFDRSGVYTFKVSLSKSCWRKISVSHRHSLGQLHDAIQEAFDFDNDHLYAFYVDGNPRTGKPIYCSDAGEGGKTAEETYIEDMGLYQGQKLYYLFDFGDMWEFGVELIKIEKGASLPPKPVITETKGKSPEQYASW